MHYMLMIYASEADWGSTSPEAQALVMRRHDALESDLRAKGQYKGCGALGSAAAAVIVRAREGEPVVTDGPFVETREQLGGYYLVEARDLDEAVAIAARIPVVGNACVEVRALQDVRLS